MLPALAAGAAWALGWGRPEITAHVEAMLLSLEATRFSLVGAKLGAGYRLEDDIPANLETRLAESVVFYHVGAAGEGVPGSLRSIPWRVLACEGRPSDAPEDLVHRLGAELTGDLDVIASAAATGAHGPVVIMLRR